MATSTATRIEIVSRQSEHLPALIELFRATHISTGYPVEGAPDADPAYWKSFITLNDSSCEVLALVASSPSKHIEAAGGGIFDPELAPNSSRPTICGHISVISPEPDEITGLLNAEPYNVQTDQIWKLTRFAVLPTEQGKGIGSMLLDAVEKEADRAQKILALGVLSKDAAAIHVYESRGWKRLGEGYMLGRDGRQWPEIFYLRSQK